MRPSKLGSIKGRNEDASRMVDSRFLVATKKKWLIVFVLFTID